ncbi:glycosyl hydrolase family 57 [Pseudanabaena biceps]|nr:glycosyl hydrolase family 57 [Pseudanabaena biceps]
MLTTQPSNISSNLLNSDLPAICGNEEEIRRAVQEDAPVFLNENNLKLEQITAAFACALHMHQPTIPAGTNGALICNLQHMFEHQGEGDNHNAGAFAWCYGRMGEFIPQLVAQGCHPRIMLDYSGNLLWGLQQMQRHDVLDNLKKITCDRQYQPYVEWLGTMWSHAVIPSTPIPDIKLHIQAWQSHFASIFGIDALKRVKGFSPPEMHLPNHPDTLYEYIKALKECGYRWLMVQEHSVERLDGSRLTQDQKYIPNRLTAKNSQGESISITCLIKTQGSDTKLVAQMQPYHEAKGRSKQMIGAVEVPSLVTQIADGENGGVMMNEFPRDYPLVWDQLKNNGGERSGVVGLNGTEYLEMIEAAGVNPLDYPEVQAVQQHKVWSKCGQDISTENVEQAIAELKANDHQFHMDGASWTNSMSWVNGYENVLEPMNQLSAKFHEKYDLLVAADSKVTKRSDYQQALLYNLLVQTSCFRYWGQGTWTDYARELYRQAQ